MLGWRGERTGIIIAVEMIMMMRMIGWNEMKRQTDGKEDIV